MSKAVLLLLYSASPSFVLRYSPSCDSRHGTVICIPQLYRISATCFCFLYAFRAHMLSLELVASSSLTPQDVPLKNLKACMSNSGHMLVASI